MKKLIALLLAAVLVMSLVACGNTDTTPETTTEAPVETTEAIEGTTEDTVAAPAIEANAATEILTTIWNAVAEDSRFFAMGGDMENMVDNAPGNYGLTDVEALTATLYVPADQVANIACASSLMHGMMANNFTAGLYQLAEGTTTADFAATMKTAIGSVQWLCGMPETLLIAEIEGEFVLVVFGINDAINPFRTALETAYPGAEIITDEAIAG